MTRVEIVEECAHGKTEPHSWGGAPIDPGWHHFPHKPNVCDQGSRRVLTEGEFLLIEKVDGEWDMDAVGIMAAASADYHMDRENQGSYAHHLDPTRAMLDALAGSE